MKSNIAFQRTPNGAAEFERQASCMYPQCSNLSPQRNTMPPYTIEDYAAAKAKFDALNEKWENYTGNNPNKYRADIEESKAQMHLIEVELKAAGLLARTAIEERDALLDAAFPNAQSREIVEWQGKKYIRRFTPAAKNLSGNTVKAWVKYWEEA